MLYSAMICILMGVLFSNLQERLKLEQYNLQVSEAALRKLNEGLLAQRPQIGDRSQRWEHF